MIIKACVPTGLYTINVFESSFSFREMQTVSWNIKSTLLLLANNIWKSQGILSPENSPSSLSVSFLYFLPHTSLLSVTSSPDTF